VNKFNKLPKSFYTRGAVTVAKDLIGKILVHKMDRYILSGIIVETEAYTGKNDPASHSFIGKTKRNEVMFEEGGKAYVYFTYGNHYCFNVVTGKKNYGNAVLIRALQPIDGIDIMRKNRSTDVLYNLTSGPGKLAQALGIDKRLYGEDLSGNNIFIIESGNTGKLKVCRSKRIGISKNTEKLYRFFAKDNPYVSKVNVKKLLKNDNH
jgi:DNA-3-methyladenine glycosylase